MTEKSIKGLNGPVTNTSATFRNFIRSSRMERDFNILKSLLIPACAAKLVKDHRGTKGMREASGEVGISPATLSRIERGFATDTKTMKLIFEWLIK